jgi:serralysin
MQTVDVVGKYVVQHDQDLVFQDQAGFVFQYNDGKPDLLVNSGTVLIDDSRYSQAVFGATASYYAYGEHDFQNRAGASFTVQATGQYATAYGISGYVNVQNDGLFEVVATQGYAYAFATGGDFANTGDVEVQGAAGAKGISFDSGAFANTGVLRVDGGAGEAVGVDFRADAFDNQGMIEAVNDGASAIAVRFQPQDPYSLVSFHNGGRIAAASTGDGSIGIQFAAPYYFDQLVLTNSGEIDADVAITGYAEFDQSIVVRNSGRITGDISLGFSADTVLNRGKIVGDVLLGLNHDLYDGSHGKIDGVVYGGLGNDTVIGGKGADVVFGDDATDSGQDGSDALFGGLGNDVLHGQGGDDTLTGGAGSDILIGGYGHDVFVFQAVGESTADLPDVISDLGRRDHIDLTAIDADVNADGDQAFHLVAAFSGHAAELTVTYDAASASTFISGDVDGDGAADLVIRAIGDHTDFTGFAF